MMRLGDGGAMFGSVDGTTGVAGFDAVPGSPATEPGADLASAPVVASETALLTGVVMGELATAAFGAGAVNAGRRSRYRVFIEHLGVFEKQTISASNPATRTEGDRS